MAYYDNEKFIEENPNSSLLNNEEINENNKDTIDIENDENKSDISDISDNDFEHNSIGEVSNHSITIDETEALIVNEKVNNNNVSNKPKVRQSSIELLRIIAILLIICHHFSIHSNFNFDEDEEKNKQNFLNHLWIQFLSLGGKISVNIYVLISGYFLSNSSKVEISKFLKLEFQLIFYAMLDYATGIFVNYTTFNFREFIHYFFPVTYDNWWFATNYVVLYLLFPFINGSIHELDRKTYRNCLIVMTMIWCVLPSIFLVSGYGYNFLIWFIYIYIFAGYIRKYKIGENTSSIIWIISGILCYFFITIFAIACDYIGMFYEPLKENIGSLFDMNRIPIFIASILIFIGFTRMNFSSRFINLISSATFGVYLIHDAFYPRYVIWTEIVNATQYTYSNKLIPYSIISILSVFVICVIIEIIRIFTIEKLYMKLIKYLSKKLENLIERFDDSNFAEKF